MRMRTLRLVLLGLCVTGALDIEGPVSIQKQLKRIHPLNGESVYAYARISPDGRRLVYSAMNAQVADQHVLRVVDLESSTTLFSESGVDGYWSTDGSRIVYLSEKDGRHSVSIWNERTGAVTREIAPVSLGDYYSWGTTPDGDDVLMTIGGNYYTLLGDKAILPHERIPYCDGMGAGTRPLISKDAKRATVFVEGKIVVRNISDCQDIVRLGLEGGKADFSWDGRYIAFHSPKPGLKGYEIQVVDIQTRRRRAVRELGGSSFFPSWTQDGRLCFRYEGLDYSGFMMVESVDSLPEIDLPRLDAHREKTLRTWRDVFPAENKPSSVLTVVLLWSSWSAHGPTSLRALEQASLRYSQNEVQFLAVSDPLVPKWHRFQPAGRTATVNIRPDVFIRTAGVNQMPSVLVFRGYDLVSVRLGAQTESDLASWIEEFRNIGPGSRH